MSIVLKAVDSFEFAVKDLKSVEQQVVNWGLTRLDETIEGATKTVLFGQGKIRIFLSQGKDDMSYAFRHASRHGDSVCNIFFDVEDAGAALEEASQRGAKVIQNPKKESTVDGGEITTASIAALGDVAHTFISRRNTTAQRAFSSVSCVEKVKGTTGLFAIDHITCNLEKGQLDQAAAFYEKVFDFKQIRYFDIRTSRTGLISRAMSNKEGTVKIPMNEPADSKSQIQEYLNIHNGPGVQHIAFATGDILDALPRLRKLGQKFLQVPDTYYEGVPKRVKGVKEDIQKLKEYQILADGEKAGYLLQIFSNTVVGPFFYEVIQRCGDEGFGEGNFRALFEAMERDQELRGVL